MTGVHSLADTGASSRTTPWHVWVVGILALLWNASGAYVIMMGQAGRLPNAKPEEVAFYAAQPAWLVIVADIALLAGIAASVAVLLRNRAAVWLFALSLAAMAGSNAYDLAVGTSLMIGNLGASIATGVIALLGVLELLYARAMRKRSVLR